MNRFKYPKTLHLPWSPGLQNDDRLMPLADVLCNFDGETIVISEKLDGENTSMYRDGIHARSLDSGHHESRSWVKALHGQIFHLIPEGWRICGENVYAHHSIFYDRLDTYFYVFNIWNEKNECISWDETLEWCTLLNLIPVSHKIMQWNLEFIQDYQINDSQEGYVIRNVNAFHYNDFQKNVAKFVRKNHIQTDQHWMSKPVVKNLLG